MLPFLADSREKYPCNGCKHKARDIIFIRHLVTTPFRLNLHDKTAPNLSNEMGVVVRNSSCKIFEGYKRAVLQW